MPHEKLFAAKKRPTTHRPDESKVHSRPRQLPCCLDDGALSQVDRHGENPFSRGAVATSCRNQLFSRD